ncbi:hypothetical protein ACPWT1_08070 [Ramlibacter sp. MMS24-I3-19]|uniref:hypothetical protein n=1 Tax=Ramlibacter sp. MMS24-I3-19 TaxID=3416606 RepID=UPI003D070C64
MKRHLVTAVILLIAILLYAVGISGGGAALVGVGGAVELWFWVRALRPRPPAAHTK